MEEDRYFDSSKTSFSDGEIPEEEPTMEELEKKPPSSRRLPILLTIGVGVLIVLMLITWFRQDPVDSGGGNRLAAIETRLQDLESRLNDVQEATERLVQLDFQNKQLVSLIQKLEQSNESMSKRMDLIAQELVTLQRRIPQTAQAEQKTAPPRGKDRTSATAVVRHEVQSGETLYSISRRYGLSVQDLRRLNDLGNDNTIRPGQKLIVTPSGAE